MSSTNAFVDSMLTRSQLMKTQQENMDLVRQNNDKAVEAGNIITTVNERNAALIEENQKYRAMLARPLQEILDENANYKKAYEEQQSLIAMWMLRQRAMKKVALDLGVKQGVGDKEIVSKAVDTIHSVMSGDNLNGMLDKEDMVYFNKHKQQIMKNN